ncbi:hypothetical protein F441_20035 [Phytophthora nicotianae CJ01A1]|uniref:Uncharacterized protein n=5 Tax=Phytophthora nicotianae TaxID=4792 RepID=W2PK47_PHYN3|nr:hypothetical protein PPTG_24262 [Phytophthora nicotianae INRA-310]ETI33128.1 hypothetical protein F443_20162 [Phytophthora nicotianae P1569]ETK73454.1 hypothetical protein L915_19614 [Phytophthora nicotianae]ETO61862.1 hypothetical protein F444_20173 [Phytophthora nicotianae P1976]ETP02953.1 hypothetical protein F441_20035 [Phytophthora nicotianae CJ01A1]ETL80125.1 hypothetical protein L917_19351 [Phytophthora nicotianae]
MGTYYPVGNEQTTMLPGYIPGSSHYPIYLAEYTHHSTPVGRAQAVERPSR